MRPEMIETLGEMTVGDKDEVLNMLGAFIRGLYDFANLPIPDPFCPSVQLLILIAAIRNRKDVTNGNA